MPAALLEAEPKRSVTYNGVTFDVSDLKALLITQYDRSTAVMVGGRCNDKEVKRDEKTGRILDEACRDTNAGTWHVVMANFLGVNKRALAEDRTYDYQVWNQPVLGWKVHKMEEITLAQAAKLLSLPENTEKYPYNENADKLFEVDASSYYVTESQPSTQSFVEEIDRFTREDRYQYILEVDKDGKMARSMAGS